MFFSKDSETKAWQPPTTDCGIIEAIKKVPTVPAETLFSRRRQVVEICGDAIVFPLEIDTADFKFVATIKEFQQMIFNVIEQDLGLVGITWTNKEDRHLEKCYKRHKALHLAMMSTSPPCSIAEYKEKKCAHTPEKIQEARQVLSDFINEKQKIRGKVVACKINPDGHIVVRVEIDNAKELFICRDKFSQIFGGCYNRYDDPEKQKTLAAVIGVVDHTKLSAVANQRLESMVKELEHILKARGWISLQAIQWIEYTKRTLSPNSRLSVWETRRNLSRQDFVCFEATRDFYELPVGLSPSTISQGVAALKQLTDAKELPKLSLTKR